MSLENSTSDQGLIASLALTIVGWGFRVGGYRSRVIGNLLIGIGSTAFLATLLWRFWPFSTLEWAAVGVLLILALLAVIARLLYGRRKFASKARFKLSRRRANIKKTLLHIMSSRDRLHALYLGSRVFPVKTGESILHTLKESAEEYRRLASDLPTRESLMHTVLATDLLSCLDRALSGPMFVEQSKRLTLKIILAYGTLSYLDESRSSQKDDRILTLLEEDLR